MPYMRDVFEKEVDNEKLTVVERLELPPREERTMPVPDAYRTGPVSKWLLSDDTLKGNLWRHQALALEAFAARNNVVLSTGTASGKSLVFQAAAIKTLQEDDEAKVLVFYPLRALVADQGVSWRHALEMADMPQEWIASITGATPMPKRDAVLEKSRIIIATPDVCHAWLMRNLTSCAVKRFLSGLDLLIIDESHVFEAVFGSNAAFLFRRLQAAARICRAKKSENRTFSIISTSATISNPGEHLHALTGLDFSVVNESQDGSPQHARSLLHLACSSEEMQTLSSISILQRKLVEQSDLGSFITFVDSRQGVERLAAQTKHDLVNPYRSGYEAEDRAAIEKALRSNRLRGVVATSALELGIDIPHFTVGLNLELPTSRKAFRQRLGRIGRSMPGVFSVVAEPNAFRRYGSSLDDYYRGSVEPSHLYLDNRFVHFAHAKCLADELDMLGVKGRSVPPGNIDWPANFSDIYEFARVGGGKARPREFDHIAGIGGDNPHPNYPLRNIAEETFQVEGSGPSGQIEKLTLQHAIREAYPGAIYMHMKHRWRVHEWRSTAWERKIKVSRWKAPINTQPLIRTFVNLSIERDGLVAGHFRNNPHGFLAECQLQITERVEGYQERGDRKLYRDLRQENPRMSPKTRDFRTTGVVLRIETQWMREDSKKRQLADALRDLTIREYSISPQDIGGTATNIAMVINGQRHSVSDAIVIYDATYGSLRLTEPVFNKLDLLIARLERSNELSSDEDALAPEQIVSGFRDWFEQLESTNPDDFSSLMDGGVELTTDGLLLVPAPGSIVTKRDSQGVRHDIEITAPQIVSLDGHEKLFYGYRTDDRATAMVSADAVELIGDEYLQKWNPKTSEYVDDDEPE